MPPPGSGRQTPRAGTGEAESSVASAPEGAGDSSADQPLPPPPPMMGAPPPAAGGGEQAGLAPPPPMMGLPPGGAGAGAARFGAPMPGAFMPQQPSAAGDGSAPAAGPFRPGFPSSGSVASGAALLLGAAQCLLREVHGQAAGMPLLDAERWPPPPACLSFIPLAADGGKGPAPPANAFMPRPGGAFMPGAPAAGGDGGGMPAPPGGSFMPAPPSAAGPGGPADTSAGGPTKPAANGASAAAPGAHWRLPACAAWLSLCFPFLQPVLLPPLLTTCAAP